MRLHLSAWSDTGRHAATGVWMLAAAGAIAIHVAGAAIGYARFNSDDADDDLGATAIEIGLEFTAPRGEPVTAPPGPDQQESAAAPPLEEQKAAVNETELPKAIPTETDDPDRVVSPDDAKKKVEETKETAKQEQKAQDAAVATNESAAPRSENAKPSEQSTAPTAGIGESTRKLSDDWNRKVSAIFSKNLRYPTDHISKKMVVVTVNMRLDRRGHVVEVNVLEGSGDPIFDEAALDMVRRSDPLPPPVLEATEDGRTFPVPVRFRPPGWSAKG